MKIKILQRDCPVEAGEDRTLPYTSYLVCYLIDGVQHYDLVTSNKNVDIFDHYYDLYKKDLLWYKQTEGRANPKLWQDPNQIKRKENE